METINLRPPISRCSRFSTITCALTLISSSIPKVDTTLPEKLFKGMTTIQSAHGGSSSWQSRINSMNLMASLMTVGSTRRLANKRQLVTELDQMQLCASKRENKRISKRVKNVNRIFQTLILMKMVLSRLRQSISRMLQWNITSSMQKWCSQERLSFRTTQSNSATWLLTWRLRRRSFQKVPASRSSKPTSLRRSHFQTNSSTWTSL